MEFSKTRLPTLGSVWLLTKLTPPLIELLSSSFKQPLQPAMLTLPTITLKRTSAMGSPVTGTSFRLHAPNGDPPPPWIRTPWPSVSWNRSTDCAPDTDTLCVTWKPTNCSTLPFQAWTLPLIVPPDTPSNTEFPFTLRLPLIRTSPVALQGPVTDTLL